MKLSTILFITSFLPVVTFKTIARVGEANWNQAKIATAVGLVLAIAQIVTSKKVNKQATYLEWAFLGFLACGFGWVYLTPEDIASLFVRNSTTILYLVLFLTTLVPQLFGFDPFTYSIAKQWAPEAVWKTSLFRTINMHITYVFSIIMLLACLSSFFGQGKPLFSIVVPMVLILGVGIPFSRLYPNFYMNRQNRIQPESFDLADFPKTARELIMKMPVKFNGDAAGALHADIQFRLSGDGGGEMFISIADKQCIAREGNAKSPALTIIAPADIWLKMARGEINRPKAFMDGLFKIEGDMELLMKMSELFSSSGDSAK
jgi:putative sterol carrier protein